MPLAWARTTMLEFWAGLALHAGGHHGGSVTNSGTAWRCMLEPIKARLASSCSRNGIRPAETPTIWPGATSMYCTCVDRHHLEVAVVAGHDVSPDQLAVLDQRVGRGQDGLVSSSARSHSISSVNLPVLDLADTA